MNERTRGLLRCIEMKAHKEGIVALSKLIGPSHGVKDAFELDAYAFGEKFPKPKRQLRKFISGNSFKDVGLKSEINSMAQIAAKKTIIKKLHNKLINRLNDYILCRQKRLKESRFDALVVGWKKGRDLLIEAKTASEGPSGRSQIRQAIGQLYDYRFKLWAPYQPNEGKRHWRTSGPPASHRENLEVCQESASLKLVPIEVSCSRCCAECGTRSGGDRKARVLCRECQGVC